MRENSKFWSITLADLWSTSSSFDLVVNKNVSHCMLYVHSKVLPVSLAEYYQNLGKSKSTYTKQIAIRSQIQRKAFYHTLQRMNLSIILNFKFLPQIYVMFYKFCNFKSLKVV